MNRASGMATSLSSSGETVVGDHLREQMPQVLAHLVQIEVLQASVPGIMEKYHYEHNLGLGQGRIAVIVAILAFPDRIPCHHGIKELAEIICQTKYSRNFVLGDHSDNCLCAFVLQYYKKLQQFSLITKFTDNYNSSNSR